MNTICNILESYILPTLLAIWFLSWAIGFIIELTNIFLNGKTN